MADLLRDGRPVIVLLKVRNGRFHYVVVVGTTDTGSIVVHDPARGPSQSLPDPKIPGRMETRWILGAAGPSGPAADVMTRRA